MRFKKHPFIIIIYIVALVVSSCSNVEELVLAKPSEKQLRFADWEVGAFIHYGLNPFTGMEHGDGQHSPELFNPKNLDVEQWVKVSKDMGARYACLTVRHEGGFCLWPTKTTDYSIVNSPYKDGKGDITREFVDACRKHGIVPALYHTAEFDANATLKNFKGLKDFELPLKWMSTWGEAMAAAHKEDPGLKERLKKMQVEQMRELLTNYGPIGFMWSDHWNAEDPDGIWRAVTDLAEELQPDMVFMGTDTWVPGNETGHVVYPMWNAVNTVDGTKYTRPAATGKDESVGNSYGLLETEVRTGHPLGKFWRVRECTTNSGFSHGGWFWHPDSIKKTYPKKHWEHLDLYYRTVGLGANTIINLPPNTDGVIPEDIAVAAKKFGDAIRERFSNPIAETKKVEKGHIVELKWHDKKKINTIVLMENIVNGQKVVKYTLEAYVNGKWQTLEPANKLMGFKPYNNNPGYETIGHKKIDRVVPVKTNRIRFKCLESVVDAVEIRSMQVFNCDPIEPNFNASYPYLSGIVSITESAHNGVRRDVNYIGEPIKLRGKTYQYGLMVCPVESDKKGTITFDMNRYSKAKGMTAHIGIEDHREGQGSSIFIVEGKKDGEWVVLYKSQVITGNDEAVDVKIDFPESLEQLRLTTTDGGDMHWNDHAIWADAMFIE